MDLSIRASLISSLRVPVILGLSLSRIDHMKMWGPNTAIGGQKMKLGKAHIRLWPLEMQRKETDNTDETGVLGECFSKVHFVFWFGFMVGCLFFFSSSIFIFGKGRRKECQKSIEAY